MREEKESNKQQYLFELVLTPQPIFLQPQHSSYDTKLHSVFWVNLHGFNSFLTSICPLPTSVEAATQSLFCFQKYPFMSMAFLIFLFADRVCSLRIGDTVKWDETNSLKMLVSWQPCRSPWLCLDGCAHALLSSTITHDVSYSLLIRIHTSQRTLIVSSMVSVVFF